MLRWLNWISKLLVAGILIAGLTLYITWVTVSMYVEKIIAKLPIEGMQQVELPELIGRLTEGFNLMKAAGGLGASEGGGGAAQGGTGTGGASDSSAAAGLNSPAPSGDGAGLGSSGTGSSGAAGAQKQPGDDALAVMGRSGTNGGTSGTGSGSGSSGTDKRELVMSTDQFLKAKDNLSDEDKMSIFSMLIARLPQDELQHISSLVEDGITEDELGEVEQIVENRLKPDEYQKLLDILQKY